jgi:ectoine hydroxylase-related dioxygenase (phytanoyl-CoA dioxygenase family)
MAEQLLGEGMLEEPERIRGIYCILPEGDAPEKAYHCHVDRHPFHLGLVGYIDDVPPQGGGFSVWPGSHKKFYYDFHSQYQHQPNEQYENDIAYFSEQPYVDCYGKAGDIIFWHHRLGHSAGHNRSRQIRQAVLYDFKRKDLADRLDTPPQENMWQDWGGIGGLSTGGRRDRADL